MSRLDETGTSKSWRGFDQPPRTRNSLLLFKTTCDEMYRAADLKNCILYSITRLSVRSASAYNSKRISPEGIQRESLRSKIRSWIVRDVVI